MSFCPLNKAFHCTNVFMLMFYSLLYLRAWQGGWHMGGTREISGKKKEIEEGRVREMARGEGGETEEQRRLKKNKASIPRNSSSGEISHRSNSVQSTFLYYREGFHTSACPRQKHSPLEPTGLERFVSSPCNSQGCNCQNCASGISKPFQPIIFG